MPIDFSEFHLLRPDFLWLLVPAFIALYGIRHIAKKQSSWQNVISPHLLKFLMVSGEKQKSYISFWLTGIISILIIFAISGPSFRQISVPVFQTESARVILLDLSLSMDATDIKPARIDRAKHKIMDLLDKNSEGTIGLVVYAGDAFIISPLTSDANTIASMIPTLSTGIMPVLGSRPDIAIKKAITLLENASQTKGQIIWITDGIDSQYSDEIIDSLKSKEHLLSILAIGTEQGAPIPLPDNSGFLKDTAGNIILPKLESANLKKVTLATNGQYVELSASSDDIEFILSTLAMDANSESSESDERISRWIDDGYWISWIVLGLMFFKLFRRTDGQVMSSGGIFFTIIFLSVMSPQNVQASALGGFWDDLWKTRDQQASQAFENQDYKKASELFENEQWQGASSYKQDDFTAAVQQFSKSDDIESIYNKANSLAKSQQFEQAIDSYNQVLEQSPTHEDALFNKKIVEDLLKQQQEQQKQEQDQENKDKQDKQDQENQDQQESDSDSDSKQEKDSEEKSEEEKNSEQQEQQEQQSKQDSEQQAEEKEAQLAEDQRDQNEKDQALEHWLEKIPDDPGGLLRRKMYREYQRRGQQQKEKKIW